MESLDCVVIGAGVSGLAAAKQYLCSKPDHSLLIFESQSSIGGSWASERLYPGLKTNSFFETYQYPDFPMESGKFGAEIDKPVPGEAVHEYLKSYSDHFQLRSLICLRTKVISARHQDEDGGWILKVQRDEKQTTLLTRRLIVATGLTSEPRLPTFVGQEAFGSRVFHGRDFRQNRDTIGTSQSATVYGSTKYAWDAAYAYATAGAEVHWIIRSSGYGPCWMSPPYVPLGLKLEDLTNVRVLTWFSPCIWGAEDGHPWARWFLHGTFVGRLIVNLFWRILSAVILGLCDFNSHPETKKLKPNLEAFYAGTSFSIINYDTNFIDLVKSGQIRIHIGEIDHLSPNTVHLSDGTSFQTQSMLVHTGWEKAPPMKFLPEGIEVELGLPHERQPLDYNGFKTARSLLQDKADQDILRRFPRLKNQPESLNSYVPLSDTKGAARNGKITEYNDLTAYMLHRFIVPPSRRFLKHRDIAFCGMAASYDVTVTAQIQSLWIAAFMAGKLDRDPVVNTLTPELTGKMKYETVLYNRFGKWRYPVDWGNKAPSFIFDSLPYFDMLLRDLGLNHARKGGILSELLLPYRTADYREIVPEWLAKHQRPKSD
ncbi:hypothetical protein QQS21_002610 [Conoideocrella luteorostrata]|uniref:Uncharacterized protein n=1 Tax=Conoideocrella luteorostrata TaxID=1105319 RepID=A0AAJ0FWG3_9HYPO|nr:hypothetical protein QQS21_002610 [Conoideocrella luteorostrata]